MKTIETINQLSDNYSSLDIDYLTEKEMDRAELYMKTCISLEPYYPDVPRRRILGEINGFKNYISSLKEKIKERKIIPNWYVSNKLNK